MLFKTSPQAFWVIGFVVIGSFMLAYGDGPMPQYYYSFQFEVEVKGVPFSGKTKVTCTAERVSGGIGSKGTIFFFPDRISFGKQLTSGEGFFVATPNMCGKLEGLYTDSKWNLADNYPVLPLMYFSDSYEGSDHIRLLINPLGPDPETSVKVISAFVSPLIGDEIEKVERISGDINDPLIGSMGNIWKGFVFFPIIPKFPLTEDQLIKTSADGQYAFYIDPRQGERDLHWAFLWSEIQQGFWDRLIGGASLNDATGPYAHNTQEIEQKLTIAAERAKTIFSNIYPLKIEKNHLVADFSLRGVADFYSKDYYKNSYSINTAVDLLLSGDPILTLKNLSDSENIIFFEKETGRYFLVHQYTFAQKYRR